MTITVRRLLPCDWVLFRDARLKALLSDPGVFNSTHAKEAATPDDKWRTDLENPDLAVFGVFDQGKRAGENIIGITGAVVVRSDDPSRCEAKLWGSWLDAAYRGQGISEQMYRCRLDWLRAHPDATHVVVSHRASNLRSKGANQKHGFVYTRTVKDYLWPDGTVDDVVFYELKLDKNL